MEKPNVVLKKVKFLQGTEGYGLNAEVYIDGLYCMFVIDDANGGDFNYQYNYIMGKEKHNAMIKERIKLLEDYIATLPEIEMESQFSDDKPFIYKLDMDGYINQLVEEQELAKAKAKADAKFNKTMVKLFETAIVFGVPNTKTYQYLNFKKPIAFYNTDAYRNIIQTHVNRVLNEYCKDGIQILNNNLKQMGITY